MKLKIMGGMRRRRRCRAREGCAAEPIILAARMAHHSQRKSAVAAAMHAPANSVSMRVHGRMSGRVLVMPNASRERVSLAAAMPLAIMVAMNAKLRGERRAMPQRPARWRSGGWHGSGSGGRGKLQVR